MNLKSLGFAFASCLVCFGAAYAPARADDDASKTVKQCFQNMQSVHSYRDKTVTLTPSLPQVDQATITEETEQPRMLHSITTNVSAKSEHESITTKDAYYLRVNQGSWTMYIRGAEEPTKIDKSLVGADGAQIRFQITLPVHDAPWGSIWKKQYDPHATYLFKRQDTLDTIPVDVYSTTSDADGQQTDTEIWIGVKDHLPHEILDHTVQDDNKFEHYTTETLSDFNAPITITVPDVAPSDPSADQMQPSGSQ